MKLIEIYIQEVTRRLPEKMRKDIELELRSTIEDMLSGNDREEDVKRVLNQLGNPAALANGYKDQPMHLIGPRYYDVYVSLLKMIVPIAGIIAFITIIAEKFIGYSGEEAIVNVILAMIGKCIVTFIEVGIQVFFWLTVTFAMIERFDNEKEQQPLTSSLKKWTADDLKNVTYIPKRRAISKFEVFGGLLWTATWATLYFYADQLVGVYKGEGGTLNFVVPAFNNDVLRQYWPIIVMIIGAEIAFAIYKLLQQQWTKKVAIGNTVLQIVTTIVFIMMVTHPNLMNQAFIAYMTDLFAITKEQLNMWIVSSGIFIFIFSAAVTIYDGYKKSIVR